MSGGNYYGFTHGGTYNAGSFQNRPTPPQPPQPPVPPVPPTAYPVNYAPAAPGFGYPPAAAPAGYPTSYQTGNTTFTTGTTATRTDNSGQPPAAYAYTAVNQNNDANNRPVYATPVAQTGYPGAGYGGTVSNVSHNQSTVATTTSAGASTYSGYEAAVYAAATSFIQSKGLASGGSQWINPKRAGGGVGGGTGYGSGGGGRGSFPKKGMNTAPKAQAQLLYCDICKISCAGSQTYREHLEGKNHKKKEAQQKAGVQPPVAKTKLSFRCDLCEVTCTGQDTYNAHVRGAKHQKTLKLHQALNKPIPSSEPTVIQPSQSAGGAPIKAILSPSDPKKVVVVPKVNFVGGQKLTTTGVVDATGKPLDTAKEGTDSNIISGYEKDVEPVGEDYVEAVRSDDGKLTAYFCKLCDCRFNDVSAKEMHLKGRRHRLQFKKKVNPNLEVEVKSGSNPKFRRMNDEKMRRDLMRLRQQDLWSMRAMYQSQMMTPPIGTPLQLFARPPVNNIGPKRETIEDRYLMTKHSAIYPTDDECNTTQKLVVFAEKSLKGVSDKLAEEAKSTGIDTPEEEERLLKGVMRVGDLAKQLMLRGDLQVELVVLCSLLPTVGLLNKIAEMLPEQLATQTEEQLQISVVESEAAIVIANPNEPCIRVSIIFTSVAFREEFDTANKTDKSAVLDKKKCLAALASLRHAKWFQARCTNLLFCCIVLRIMKDLRQRIPAWAPLTSWPLELLVEKVICSSPSQGSVAEIFRHVLECIASGILMKCGPGLLDPCEKDVVDAAACLTSQQREDITASAQHFLRLISFGQLYKVLGMEKLSDLDGAVSGQQRKRPRESGFDATEMTEETNGKKDKRENESS